ncbi:MAG TPA: T9SS type A sorting domain-containing protein [Ignavibacteria bacterium]|nr:T9SS type A sorting domain-containing protein [Ignavibacteria bacterium]
MKKLLALIILILTSNIASAGDPGATVGWSALGTGLNGEVKAITYYNGNLIAAGSFTMAGGLSANRIAMWNGASWSPLGQGVSGTVYALQVYNGNLYVGGLFTSAGGVTYTSYIARWNGASWSAVGTGLNDEVTSFAVFNGELIAGGKFNVGSSYNIARWNGTSWMPMGSGTNEDVNALTLWGDTLIAAGRFSTAGGGSASKIAKWYNGYWFPINNATFNDEIFSVGVFNDLLYAGGKFTIGTGVQSNYLVCFYGGNWVKVGNGVEDRIYSILYYGHSMVVGGQHKFSYNTIAPDSVYVNRISVFDGLKWSGFYTGMNDKVNAVIEGPDGSLIAAGEFTTAGGRVANRIAIWDTLSQVSISGTIRFRGSNLPVQGGYVKAVRVDLNTRQALVVDSTNITSSGNYTLNKVRRNDTVDVIAFPEDIIEQDFTPTYYPSTPYWQGATRLYVSGNLTDINILVDTANAVSATGSVTGQVILNYTPPGFIGTGLGLDFKSSAIVYAKMGGVFRNFGITDNYQIYSVTSLPAGSYEMIANRLGYTSDTVIVNVPAGGTVNNINFNLKPLDNPVGIDPGGIEIVKDFKLNQNYPNPFNPETTIEFTLDKPGFVSLKIYNILGKEIASFYNERLNEGNHMLKWNAGSHSSGVYYYKLSFNGVEQTKSMVLIK